MGHWRQQYGDNGLAERHGVGIERDATILLLLYCLRETIRINCRFRKKSVLSKTAPTLFVLFLGRLQLFILWLFFFIPVIKIIKILYAHNRFNIPIPIYNNATL